MLSEELDDTKSFKVNNYFNTLFSVINFIGTLGPRTLLHDCRIVLQKKYHPQTTKTYRLKCLIRAILVGLMTIFGFIWPTVITPALGLNMQAVFLQVMGFLPAGAYIGGILTIGLTVSAFSAWLFDKVLDQTFNRYYKTDHIKLYFSDEEVQQLLSQPALKKTFENEATLREAIQFLREEYNSKKNMQFSDATRPKVLKIAQKLRSGDPDPLIKYLSVKIHGIDVVLEQNNDKITPTIEVQVKNYLNQQCADPNIQMKFLLSIAKQCQKDIHSDESNHIGKQAQLQHVLDLSANFHKKLSIKDKKEPTSPVFTPSLSLDKQKKARYEARRQKLWPLLKTLTQNNAPQKVKP